MKRLSNRGLTFVEVIMAMGILATTLCAILTTYFTISYLISTSRNVNVATDAALGLMEEIRNSPFPQIVDNYNGLTFIVNSMPANRGVVYVDDTDPELLNITISVCWQQSNKVIGEDQNLNGQLDSGEDLNSNGIIDSTAELMTQIANR